MAAVEVEVAVVVVVDSVEVVAHAWEAVVAWHVLAAACRVRRLPWAVLRPSADPSEARDPREVFQDLRAALVQVAAPLRDRRPV